MEQKVKGLVAALSGPLSRFTQKRSGEQPAAAAPAPVPPAVPAPVDAGDVVAPLPPPVTAPAAELPPVPPRVITEDLSIYGKNDLLATISHQMRAPLYGMIGMVDLVLDSQLPPDQRDQLETTQRCAHSLLALLDDILDLSRIESGQLRLERIPFDLRFVIEDCVRSLQMEARQKGLTLASVLGTGVPGQLVGDPLRLRQILQNLLSNALKFTEHGSICVTVERQGLDIGSDVELKLTVADTGIGIPAAMQGRIFERYLPSQEGGPASGRGFGLPITRRLAELFGGRIWVESEVGQGSRFHVTLRFEAASDALPLTRTGDWMTTGQRGRRRILVAEDNLVNQKVVTAILAKRGYEIEVAANGVSAIEKLSQAPFDLVLMDVHMPLMDGLEAVKKIRANPKWQNLPVLALTGDSLRANREKCLLAGMTGHVAKPVRPSVLVQTIELFLNGEENESPESRDARLLDAQMNLLEGMVVLFLQLAPERMERIGAAMGQHDFVTLSREAYRLRNAAERISAAEVVQTARQVEEAAKHNDIDLAQRSLVALCREIGRMSKTVKPEFV